MAGPARPNLQNTPLVLCIIDGWGVAPHTDGNAVTHAKLVHWPRLEQDGLATTVEASGPAVGLPEGQMGNSEVGHLNIGAGHIVFQDIVRIDRDIRERRFAKNPVLRDAFTYARDAKKRVHLAGLIGPGGVHSHERHMRALLELAAAMKVRNAQVHALLDGRDTPPKSAEGYLETLEADLARTKAGQIATVTGRYYTMDRDQRWDRTERGYRGMVQREGHNAASAREALEKAYERGQNDEFVEPTCIDGGHPVAPGDVFLFVNFRPDRARQITRALVDPAFDAFPTEPLDLHYVCMTQYDDKFPAFAKIAYQPERPAVTLGSHLAAHGVRQLRIAETEKYAHVTYFFSGGREEPFEGEERILVPSPRVATYDLQPEMSSVEVTNRLLERLGDPDRPDIVVLNYANPDMVGHTGAYAPAVRAVESIDTALGRLRDALSSLGGTLMITADHGNVEEMLDAEGNRVTKHTTNPVPLIIVPPEGGLAPGSRLASGGILANVAPTLLDVIGLAPPPEMDQASLLERPSD